MTEAPYIVLPSGLMARVRAVGLDAWLGCRGDVVSMARHAIVFEDEAPDIDESDAAVLVRWAVGEMGADDLDALALVATTYHVTASGYLGIGDGPAALTLDLLVANCVAEHKMAAGSGEDAEPRGADSPTAAFASMDDPQLEELRRERRQR